MDRIDTNNDNKIEYISRVKKILDPNASLNIEWNSFEVMCDNSGKSPDEIVTSLGKMVGPQAKELIDSDRDALVEKLRQIRITRDDKVRHQIVAPEDGKGHVKGIFFVYRFSTVQLDENHLDNNTGKILKVTLVSATIAKFDVDLSKEFLWKNWKQTEVINIINEEFNKQIAFEIKRSNQLSKAGTNLTRS